MGHKYKLIHRESYNGYDSLIELANNNKNTYFVLHQSCEHSPWWCIHDSYENIGEKYADLKKAMDNNNNVLHWIFGSYDFDPEHSEEGIKDAYELYFGHEYKSIIQAPIDYINTKFIVENFPVDFYPTQFLSGVINDIYMDPLKFDKLADMLYDPSKELTIPFTCLNRGPWVHRCMMVDYLAKYNLLDKSVFSWQDADTSGWNWKYWECKQTLIDTYYDPNGEGSHYKRISDKSAAPIFREIPEVCNKALIDLVNETSTERKFFTEKTFRSVVLGRPLVIHGCKDMNTVFEDKLGFKLYHNIIDYSFDLCDSIETRSDMLAQQMLDLNNRDLNQLYDESRATIKHNVSRAIEIHRTQEFMPEILYKIFTKQIECEIPDPVYYFDSYRHDNELLNKMENIIIKRLEL